MYDLMMVMNIARTCNDSNIKGEYGTCNHSGWAKINRGDVGNPNVDDGGSPHSFDDPSKISNDISIHSVCNAFQPLLHVTCRGAFALAQITSGQNIEGNLLLLSAPSLWTLTRKHVSDDDELQRLALACRRSDPGNHC